MKTIYENRLNVRKYCGNEYPNGATVCLGTIYPVKEQWIFERIKSRRLKFVEKKPEPKPDKNNYHGNVTITFGSFKLVLFYYYLEIYNNIFYVIIMRYK